MVKKESATCNVTREKYSFTATLRDRICGDFIVGRCYRRQRWANKLRIYSASRDVRSLSADRRGGRRGVVARRCRGPVRGLRVAQRSPSRPKPWPPDVMIFGQDRRGRAFGNSPRLVIGADTVANREAP